MLLKMYAYPRFNLEAEEVFFNESSSPAPDELGNSNNSSDEKLPRDMQFNSGHVLNISFYSVVFVLSVIGNFAILASICRRKSASVPLSRADFFHYHLAIAHLMVTLFMMPLEIGWSITVSWRAGDFLCRVMSFFRIFGLYLTPFITVCLAFDRCLAANIPTQDISYAKRVKLVTASWLLSAICSFPQVLIFHVETHPTFTWYKQCVTFNVFTSPESELMYYLFSAGMMHVFPVISLVLLCIPMARNVLAMEPENIEQTKLLKSIRVALVIAAIFFLCYTPYYILCFWYWLDPELGTKITQRVSKGLFLLMNINPVLYPVVYGLSYGRRTQRE